MNSYKKRKTRRNKRGFLILNAKVNKKTKKRATCIRAVGGQAIGAGGYGCVFRPALKCKHKERSSSNKVSKLMTAKHSEQEYNDITKFKPLLATIKDYEKYFLINGVEICQPDKLTESDMISFEDTCSRAFKTDNLTKLNVNDKLDELLVLTMPDGGIDIDKNYKKNDTPKMILRINSSLVQLLKHGIVPMNKLRIYHCDIKGSNILIDSMGDTRLIDWGLSQKYEPTEETNQFSRTLQFNVPFSVLLLNNIFIEMYESFLNRNKGKSVSTKEIFSFIKYYMKFFTKKHGHGHIKTLTLIFKKLFGEKFYSNTSENKEDNITYDFIYTHLTKIVMEYTKDDVFLKRELLEQLFLPTIDIWGFIISYVDLLNAPLEYGIFPQLKHIFTTYLYDNPITPINVDNLTRDLNKLDDLLSNIPTTSHSITDSVSYSNTSGRISQKNKSVSRRLTRKIKYS